VKRTRGAEGPGPSINHLPSKLMSKAATLIWQKSCVGICSMAFKIVAEREDQTVCMEQGSILFTVAKARIFVSEGWSIVITGSEGEVLYPEQHETPVIADVPPLTPLTTATNCPQQWAKETYPP
jgi:hypothetical protein